MRYDNEHKEQTRNRVLKAAAKAIRADGPHRVGVAAVMAEAGLTHGGFYAHFSSKDALIAAAIGQMFDEGASRIQRETADRSAADGLAAYVDFYLSKKHRDAPGLGCPMAALASDLPRLDAASREAFAAGMNRLTRAIGEKLAALPASGKGKAGTMEPQARSMIAELVGALSLSRIEPDAVRSDGILSASRLALKQRFGLESTK